MYVNSLFTLAFSILSGSITSTSPSKFSKEFFFSCALGGNPYSVTLPIRCSFDKNQLSLISSRASSADLGYDSIRLF